MSKADELAKLFELKKNGVLSDGEFEREKKLVLEGTIARPASPLHVDSNLSGGRAATSHELRAAGASAGGMPEM